MLTARQKEILTFIQESTQENGYPPTLREIGEKMGIKSTNGVYEHISALQKKGYIQKDEQKSRGLRAAKKEVEWVASGESELVSIPVVGRCAAGQPILAVENIEDTVKVDRLLLGAHNDLFALRIQGDSMIEAGILNGDYIFVKKQPMAKPGEIVVAMINEEATVKYFYPEKDKIIFKPANYRMSPIVVNRQEFKTVDLIGTVIGIYRKIH